jgi:UDP-N-acetylmuramoyl-L-alanyl-D-glutamate--2,6-diaminopimelate ligase
MMPEQQMKPGYFLAALLDGVAQVTAADNVQIMGLSLKAQAVAPGDLFLAVAGHRTHGLHYMDEALSRGATAVVWEPNGDIWPAAATSHAPIIAIENLSGRLGLIADRFFRHPSRYLTMIGVTGTDGKTSVSHFLAHALNESSKRCGLIGTLGYGLYGRLSAGGQTTPNAIRLHAELARIRAQGASSVVMEVSSHALAQHRIDGVAMDVAILTNLTRDHLDYHESSAAYAAAKRRLFQMPELGHIVVNINDPFGCELAESLGHKVDTVAYGTSGLPPLACQTVWATEIQSAFSGMRFKVQTPHGSGVIESALLGRFNVGNLLAALAALLVLGMPLPRALARLSNARSAPGRMERHGGGQKPIVVVDYAHTPAALAQVLIALREHCRGRLWCVFGCGGDRDTGKRSLMAQVVERHADEAIVTDDNPRNEPPTVIINDILKGFSNRMAVRVIHDRAEAISHAVGQACVGDIVLVAGKGHEQVQIVGGKQRPFSDRQQVEQWLGEHWS